jgi:hypothetical protein
MEQDTALSFMLYLKAKLDAEVEQRSKLQLLLAKANMYINCDPGCKARAGNKCECGMADLKQEIKLALYGLTAKDLQ